jgi:hypothetical protein
MDFHRIWYWGVFTEICRNISILIESDDNNWHSGWRPRRVLAHGNDCAGNPRSGNVPSHSQRSTVKSVAKGTWLLHWEHSSDVYCNNIYTASRCLCRRPVVLLQPNYESFSIQGDSREQRAVQKILNKINAKCIKLFHMHACGFKDWTFYNLYSTKLVGCRSNLLVAADAGKCTEKNSQF